MKKLGEVLNLVLVVPPHGENTFLMPANSDTQITHLQDGVLDCIELIAMASIHFIYYHLLYFNGK